MPPKKIPTTDPVDETVSVSTPRLIEANPAGLIYIKIPRIMSLVGVIGKEKKNTTQGYMFRGIDDMYNALNKHLADEGVFFTSEVLDTSREERTSSKGGMLMYSIIKMKFRAFCSDGSFVESTTIGEAMDSADKSMNKAMSTAYKYALMQIFCIPTNEDKDTEQVTHEVAPKAPPVTIKTVTPPPMTHTPPPEHGFKPAPVAPVVPLATQTPTLEKHKCAKCKFVNEVELKAGKYGAYFKCPHCEQNSSAWKQE